MMDVFLKALHLEADHLAYWLDEALHKTVGELLGSGPRAVTSAKELIRAIGGMSLEEAVPCTAQWIAALRATPEAKEGMQAFLDKRKADFQGK